MPVFMVATGFLSGCVGNKSPTNGGSKPPPVLNTIAVNVDSGPTAAPGAINRPYVTVRVCAAGTTQCANIDHVLLDTGSSGLRLVRSVLTSGGVTLATQIDAQGRTLEECVTFGGGQTWGPVALADVTLAGEVAAKLPMQVMDDTSAGAPPPATCGANGSLANGVAGFSANGLLGVGVFAQDCGPACVNAATPLPTYYGCTAAGVCSAQNLALAGQVTNPVAAFPADNNGIIVNMPKLINANGDASVPGELTFGLSTQSDNALPVTGLTVLGADTAGDFVATYNGGTAPLKSQFDSGTDSYALNDSTLKKCLATDPGSTGTFIGYYCPLGAPINVTVVNTGAGSAAVPSVTANFQFAIGDANTFVAGAAAFLNLAGVSNVSRFTYGMPFFYGRKVYLGIEQRTAGSYTGPYYAY